MPKEKAEYIKQSLEMDATDLDLQDYLQECGVTMLASDQLQCIINERLNF